jgi:hypothetical protein
VVVVAVGAEELATALQAQGAWAARAVGGGVREEGARDPVSRLLAAALARSSLGA